MRGGGGGAAAGRWPGPADLVGRRPWPRRPRLLPTPGPQGRAPARPRSQTHQVVCVKRCGNLQHYQSGLRSSAVPRDEGTVNDRVGLPLLTLNLAIQKSALSICGQTGVNSSRFLPPKGRLRCQTAAIFTAEGSEIAASTLMEILLTNDFKLVIKRSQNQRPWVHFGGPVAWLPHWVYSWDVMEPVTNLSTFANSMVFSAYFVVTRQNHRYQLLRVRSFFTSCVRNQSNGIPCGAVQVKRSCQGHRIPQTGGHSIRLRMQGKELKEKS
ncbi:hypothetical protein GH733_009465 [Mirounga leonina]|nr:hypothetical protein GH733_009465 [Mirounga leonina]